VTRNTDAGNSVSRFAIVVAIILCGLEAVKLVLFFLGQPAYRASDGAGYWTLGHQVASGDIWMLRDPVAYRTPGYPWLLGVLQLLSPNHAWKLVVALQYLAVWLTTVLTGWWTWKITGRAWLSVLALAICFLSAGRASHASSIMTETFFTLFMTLMLYSLCHCDTRHSFRWMLMAAVFWGLAWLLRPVAIVLALAWLIACWWSDRHRSEKVWRNRLIHVAVTFGVLIAMLGPWLVRNHFLFHRNSLTVFLGRELWLATFGPGQPASAPLPDTAESQRLQELVLKSGEFSEWNVNWLVSYRLTGVGLSDVEADELMRTVSMQAIAKSPFRFLARWAVRSVDFWRSVYSRPMAFYENVLESERLPDGVAENWNWPQCQRIRDKWLTNTWEGRLLGIELTSLLALTGLAGLWLSPRTWHFAAIATTSILCMAICTSMVEYPSYRYRMVLEPIMITVGIAGWNVLIDVMILGTRSLWNETA
jgi:hypothetical protein